MKNLSGYSEFSNILELVFVLSHGQADIGRAKLKITFHVMKLSLTHTLFLQKC